MGHARSTPYLRTLDKVPQEESPQQNYTYSNISTVLQAITHFTEYGKVIILLHYYFCLELLKRTKHVHQLLPPKRRRPARELLGFSFDSAA